MSVYPVIEKGKHGGFYISIRSVNYGDDDKPKVLTLGDCYLGIPELVMLYSQIQDLLKDEEQAIKDMHYEFKKTKFKFLSPARKVSEILKQIDFRWWKRNYTLTMWR